MNRSSGISFPNSRFQAGYSTTQPIGTCKSTLRRGAVVQGCMLLDKRAFHRNLGRVNRTPLFAAAPVQQRFNAVLASSRSCGVVGRGPPWIAVGLPYMQPDETGERLKMLVHCLRVEL
jgi:hypothetical protein